MAFQIKKIPLTYLTSLSSLVLCFQIVDRILIKVLPLEHHSVCYTLKNILPLQIAIESTPESVVCVHTHDQQFYVMSILKITLQTPKLHLFGDVPVGSLVKHNLMVKNLWECPINTIRVYLENPNFIGLEHKVIKR